MFELYDLYNSIREKPLTWGSVLAILLFIVDKLFKQLFIRYIRKFLHIRDREGVLMHMERLNTIENKLDLLLKERGLPSDVHGSTKSLTDSARKRSRFSRLSTTMPTIAKSATKFTAYGGRKMSEANKDELRKILIIPILSFLAGYIKDRTGYALPNLYLDQSADILLYVVIPAVATLMHPHKKGTVNDGIQSTFERTE